jgi:predicted  nucleic acid-binding Zn-ribbon protein
MEFIYFIAGILIVLGLYAMQAIYKIKREYTHITGVYSHLIDQTNEELGQNGDRLNKLENLLDTLTTTMKSDQYSSQSLLNTRVGEIEASTNDNLNSISGIKESVEINFSRIYSDIQQVKKNIKSLNEDPNLLSRY